MIYETYFVSMFTTFIVGNYYKLSYFKIHNYLMFVLSLNIYIFYDVPLMYNYEYLISSIQPYEHIKQLTQCLISYLFVDLLFNPNIEKQMIFHHINVIIALIISLFGNNIGFANNCITSEFSTIWLALILILSDTELLIFKKIKNVSMALFLIAFIKCRVIPCTMMTISIINNIEYIYFSNINIIHALTGIIHSGLQYYWFILFINKIYNKLRKQMYNSIKIN
jgi:hypothetical protein